MNLINNAISFWNKLFPTQELAQDATHEEVVAKMENAPSFEQMKADILSEVKTSFDSQITELTSKVTAFESRVKELEAVNVALSAEKTTLATELEAVKSTNVELTSKNEVLAKELATIKASTQVVVTEDARQDSGLSSFVSKVRELTGESKY
jgi:chromosome segregation ATPase